MLAEHDRQPFDPRRRNAVAAFILPHLDRYGVVVPLVAERAAEVSHREAELAANRLELLWGHGYCVACLL
jgi:hypothetical protein